MPTPEEIQQIESLIWTGETINIELAKQLAKSLGMSNIQLLEDIENLYAAEKQHRNFYTDIDFKKRLTQLYQYGYWKVENRDNIAALEKMMLPFVQFIKHCTLLGSGIGKHRVPYFPNFLKQVQSLEILEGFFLLDNEVETWTLPHLKKLILHEYTLNKKFDLQELEYLNICDITTNNLPILEQIEQFPKLKTIQLEFIESYTTNAYGFDTIFYDYDYQKVIEKVQNYKHIQLIAMLLP